MPTYQNPSFLQNHKPSPVPTSPSYYPQSPISAQNYRTSENVQHHGGQNIQQFQRKTQSVQISEFPPSHSIPRKVFPRAIRT